MQTKQRPKSFDNAVFALVAEIPFGRVVTYGQIARVLGYPHRARQVAWALHRAPEGSSLPCHRVVSAGGWLRAGWHFGHPNALRQILEREGVHFLSSDRVDLERSGWSPPVDTASSDEVHDFQNITLLDSD